MPMPTDRVFKASAIQSVIPRGLAYDVDREQHFIDFVECCRNWVDYVNSSPQYATTDLNETQTRCVAIRDVSTEPPVVDFLTTPPTRFTFEHVQRGGNWFGGSIAALFLSSICWCTSRLSSRHVLALPFSSTPLVSS